MSKLVRVVVLATALISALGAVASSAGAVSWDNSGDTAFTATSGAVTFSTTGAALSCTGSTTSGTVPSGSTLGVVLSFAATMSFSGCRFSNVNTSIECGQTFTLTSQPAGTVVTGAVDMTCGMYQSGSMLCELAGSLSLTYSNGVPGTFNTATGGSMIISNASFGSCPWGNGELLHFTPITWLVSSGGGPHFTRTA
jgi:hypothetical protein